jgi:DNA (cytosine-5)-methyltransferase 1
MKFGSLFAGIGGFDLGLERAGMECVWQVENDPYCNKVLEKHWPDVRRYGDVREVHGIVAHSEFAGTLRQEEDKTLSGNRGTSEIIHRVRAAEEIDASGVRRGGVDTRCPSCLPPVDLICGGFPCQPFSVAGKQEGAADDRYLWPEMFRVIQEVRPTWVLGENVAGIIRLGLDEVLSDLESADYQTQTFVIPACAVDAPHRRDRVWIIAQDSKCGRFIHGGDGKEESEIRGQRESGAGSGDGIYREENVENPRCELPQGSVKRREMELEDRREVADFLKRPSEALGESRVWLPEPDVGRVAHGIPRRVDRLRCLGNAVVVPLVEIIGRAIWDCHYHNPE